MPDKHNESNIEGNKNIGIQGVNNSNVTLNIHEAADGNKIPRHLTAPPLVPRIFEGREADLKAVHDHLFADTNVLLLVNGEGGIGKTTLAAKYWERYEKEYAHMAWVFTQQSIADALLQLCLPLGLTFADGTNTEDRLKELLRAMAGLNRPCLLILDNANDLGDLHERYDSLHSCTQFHILLTTRVTALGDAVVYPIAPLGLEDAIILFKKHYPRLADAEQDLLKDIYHAVGGNTLVLELLAKNLNVVNSNETIYPLTSLLADLQKRGLLRLSQTDKVDMVVKGRGSLLRVEPIKIISALYDDVEMITPLTPEQQKLLSNLAVLPAESIPYSILKTLLTPPDAAVFSKTLDGLALRGWIEKTSLDKGGSSFKISPVVQEIVRGKNADGLWGDCEGLMGVLIDKLEFEGYTGHLINATYEEAALLARYAEAAVAGFEEAHDAVGILCDRLGSYYHTMGNLGKALSYYERYNDLEKELHVAYPDNARFKNNLAVSYQYLGITYSSLGDLGKALNYYERYNELREELYEAYPEHVAFKNGLAVSYSKLGSTHTSLGNLDKALSYYEQYNVLEKELHEAYPENVGCKNNLAISYQYLGITYSSLGDLDKALNYYERYNELEKELHEAYPQNVEFKNGLAISYAFLGVTYASLSNLDLALNYFDLYNKLEKELHEMFSQNVVFKYHLAVSYIKMGDIHEKLGDESLSTSYYQQSLELYQQLVASSPQYVEFKKNLQWVEEKLGGG